MASFDYNDPIGWLGQKYTALEDIAGKPVMHGLTCLAGWYLFRQYGINRYANHVFNKAAMSSDDAYCSKSIAQLHYIGVGRIVSNVVGMCFALLQGSIPLALLAGTSTAVMCKYDYTHTPDQGEKLKVVAHYRSAPNAHTIRAAQKLAISCHGSHVSPLVTLATITIVAFTVFHLTLSLSIAVTTAVAICLLMRRGLQIEALKSSNEKLSQTVLKLEGDIETQLRLLTKP